MVNLYHSAGLILWTYAHYVVYNRAYFAGLIFTVRSFAKIGPLKKISRYNYGTCRMWEKPLTHSLVYKACYYFEQHIYEVGCLNCLVDNNLIMVTGWRQIPPFLLNTRLNAWLSPKHHSQTPTVPQGCSPIANANAHFQCFTCWILEVLSQRNC